MTEKDFLTILLAEDIIPKISALQKLVKNPLPNCSPSFITHLQSLSNHDDIGLRFWAKKALALCKTSFQDQKNEKEIAEELSVDILFKKLQSAQSHFLANEILAKIFEKRENSSFPKLVEYLKSCTDNIVISYLVKNLSIYFPNEATLSVVAPYLKYQDDRVVANCVEGLEFISSPKATVFINQMLAHENHRVKANAAKALSSRDPETTKKVIRFMLNASEKPHFIIAACFALKQTRYEEFLPKLVSFLNDPLLSESALIAIVGIGGEAALGYLKAYIETTDDSETKDRIDVGISTVRLNMGLQKVGDTVEKAVRSGKNFGKAVVSIIRGGLESKLEQTEDEHKLSERLESAKRSTINWKDVFLKKLRELNMPDIKNKAASVAIIGLAMVLLLSFLTTLFSPSKRTSIQTGKRILEIASRDIDFRKNIRTLSSSASVLSKICGAVINFSPLLSRIKALHNSRLGGKSVYDLLGSGGETFVELGDFRNKVEKVIEFIEVSIDKATNIDRICREIGQPFQELDNILLTFEQNIYSWDNVEKAVQAAKIVLEMNESFKKEVDGLCQKLLETKRYLDDLATSSILKKIAEMTLVGHLASGFISAISTINSSLEMAQSGLIPLKDYFSKDVLVLEEIANSTQGIERIPD